MSNASRKAAGGLSGSKGRKPGAETQSEGKAGGTAARRCPEGETGRVGRKPNNERQPENERTRRSRRLRPEEFGATRVEVRIRGRAGGEAEGASWRLIRRQRRRARADDEIRRSGLGGLAARLVRGRVEGAAEGASQRQAGRQRRKARQTMRVGGHGFWRAGRQRKLTASSRQGRG